MSYVRHIDFYAAEWLEGTSELDNACRGLYITACALIYARGGPISIDLLRAATRDHGRAFNRQIETLMRLGKLTENAGEITNKRCENELKMVDKRIENARENGKKGGRPTNEIKELGKATGCFVENLTTNHQPPLSDSSLRSESERATAERQEAKHGSRGTRLPGDWRPGERDREFAASLGLDASWIAGSFCDYWLAKTGAGGTKRDWSATWRNWCRREAERLDRRAAGGVGARGYRSQPPSIVDILDRVHIPAAAAGVH